MSPPLDQLITQLEGARGRHDLERAISRGIAGFDLGGYIYVSGHVHGKRTGLAQHTLISSFGGEPSDPDLETAHDWLDRIIGRASVGPLPFFWSTASMASARPNGPDLLILGPLLQNDGRPGIQRGWTVPVHDVSGRVAAMSFVPSRDPDGFAALVDRHKVLLHVMTIYFHAYARKLLDPCGDPVSAMLTPRERQCLEWAARGKSRTDIGQIISLSPRTVKFHLENAQRKLNVARTTQAVLRAAMLGLITVPDDL